ncbi:UPF0450 protein C17orf58 homolog isoform X3 [Dendrobates tinctorius]
MSKGGKMMTSKLPLDNHTGLRKADPRHHDSPTAHRNYQLDSVLTAPHNHTKGVPHHESNRPGKSRPQAWEATQLTNRHPMGPLPHRRVFRKDGAERTCAAECHREREEREVFCHSDFGEYLPGLRHSYRYQDHPVPRPPITKTTQDRSMPKPSSTINSRYQDLRYLDLPVPRRPGTKTAQYQDHLTPTPPNIKASQYQDRPIPRPSNTKTSRYQDRPIPRPSNTNPAQYQGFPVPRPPNTKTSRYQDQPIPRLLGTKTARYEDCPIPRPPGTKVSQYLDFPVPRPPNTKTSR